MNDRECVFDESMRRGFVEQNAAAVQSESKDAEKIRLESIYGVGNVLTTDEATDKYEFISFMAPFVVAKNRETGQRGCLEFQDRPRLFFRWTPK